VKSLSYLNKYLYKYKHYLLGGTLFLVISNVFAIAPALVVRYAFDLVKENIDLYRQFDGLALQENIFELFAGSILVYGLVILGMALLRGVFLFLVRQTMIAMSRYIEYDLKNEIYAHYQTLPLSFYRSQSTGDLMARISEDVGKVRMYLGPALMYGVNLLTLFAILIPYMFTINTRLTLYVLLPLPILSISIYFVNNIIEERSTKIQQALSGLSTFTQEAFSGIRVIKAFSRESDSAREFDNLSNEYKDKSLRLTYVNALFFPLIMALIGLSVVLTVYIGGLEVMEGSITVGNIAEFIIYVNLLTWPVTSLGWISSIIQQAAASQKRINEFLDTKTSIVSTENQKHDIAGAVTFDNVSLVYPDSGIKALKDISFSVEPGQSLAIIGTTGSGKSTIANLLMRLYDPTSGEVEIDGHSLKSFDVGYLRNQMGYVPQDVFLFSDSIRNNIAWGDPELSQEVVEQSAQDADLLGNIQDFPQGFDTKLGERGITLSGGQKQRTSIARAIARDPKILILDDALSAVDTHTENTILNNLKRIMRGRTSLIISHRVSSAKLADHILVLDDGEIVEQGSHEDLLAHNGTYRQLYEKQLQEEAEVD
jgi:ATP-binding cassette subfamily B protein